MNIELLNTTSNSTKQAIDTVITVITSYGMNVLGAILILLIGFRVASWLKKITQKAMKRAQLDETLSQFLSSMIKYTVIAFTIIAVLSRFGVQTTSLIALLGAAGLAIGLSLQGTLSHIAAGIMLLIFRPFKIGDYIEAADQAGTVKTIGLFTTDLATPDNVKIVIPNAQLWEKALKNFSGNKTRRVQLVVGIDYGDSIDAAIKIINTLIKKDKRVHTTPASLVAVKELGDSSVNLIVRVWCDASDYWAVTFDMTKAIKEAFDDNGISMPFPQRSVHMVQPEPVQKKKKST